MAQTIDNNKETKVNKALDQLTKTLNENVTPILTAIQSLYQYPAREKILLQSRILNGLLRPEISDIYNTKWGNKNSIYRSSTLSVSAQKTICYLNYLGNSADCNWLSLSAQNLSNEAIRRGEKNTKTVTSWVQTCEEIIKKEIQNSSSFYSNVFTNWADWWIQGVSCLRIDVNPSSEDKNNILFQNINIDDIAINVSDSGEITQIVYRYELSFNDILYNKQISINNLFNSAEETTSYQNNQNNFYSSNNKRFKFYDFIIKREKNKTGIAELDQAFNNAEFSIKYNFGRYVRIIVCENTGRIISLNAEDEFPYVLSRLFPNNNDIYGKSSLWGAVKLFEFERLLHIAKEKSITYHVNPVMLKSPSFDGTSFNNNGRRIAPGDLLGALDANGRPQLVPLQFGGDLRLLEVTYQQVLQEAQDALMANDILPANVSGNLSATESIRIALQWSRRIKPLIEIRKQDFYMPLTKRVLDLLYLLDKLPPFPFDLQNEETGEILNPIDLLNISFTGQLKNYEQKQSVSNIIEWLTIINNANAGNIIRLDEVVNDITNKYNMPTSFIKSPEQLEAERQSQQEQQLLQEERRQQTEKR